MPDNDWDQSSNNEPHVAIQPIRYEWDTPEWRARRAAELAHYEQRRAARELRNPEIVIPELDQDFLTANFPNISDSSSWSANRLMWICHDCGCFGYKLGAPRELTKCYNARCRSRNVLIARAGDISVALRNRSVGVLLTDVFAARQERQRNDRAQRRANRSNT